jgi:AcrR family transcriptional regulator
MPKVSGSTDNKHQARTKETQARILDAAQALFADQGFEKTQLEEVAARAGYTRGAIYAHYSSKEDLFLALMEQRVYSKFGSLLIDLENENDLKKRPVIFKRWLTRQITDHSWGTLTLEFKLYALRKPSSREKLQHLYQFVLKSSGKDLVELLFGKGLSRAARSAVERRLSVVGAALSALILESHFRPDLFPDNQLKTIAEELIDSLLHT